MGVHVAPEYAFAAGEEVQVDYGEGFADFPVYSVWSISVGIGTHMQQGF
jgi:hypothetical protein